MKIVDLNKEQVEDIETRLDKYDEALGYKCVGQYENSADGYSEYFFMKKIA